MPEQKKELQSNMACAGLDIPAGFVGRPNPTPVQSLAVQGQGPFNKGYGWGSLCTYQPSKLLDCSIPQPPHPYSFHVTASGSGRIIRGLPIVAAKASKFEASSYQIVVMGSLLPSRANWGSLNLSFVIPASSLLVVSKEQGNMLYRDYT